MKNWWLYILKLEQGKWYVGITSKTPEERFQEHVLKKRGAYWTMKYTPVAIEKTEDLGIVSKKHAEKYENKITRLLMRERGINNVRGGDLKHVDEYVRLFGWIYFKEEWKFIAVIILETIVIAVLLIDKLFPK